MHSFNIPRWIFKVSRPVGIHGLFILEINRRPLSKIKQYNCYCKLIHSTNCPKIISSPKLVYLPWWRWDGKPSKCQHPPQGHRISVWKWCEDYGGLPPACCDNAISPPKNMQRGVDVRAPFQRHNEVGLLPFTLRFKPNLNSDWGLAATLAPRHRTCWYR